MTGERLARDAGHGGQDETGVDPVNDNSLGGDRVPADSPIAERLGHDPGNIGHEVTDAGDMTYPAPDAGSGDDLGAGNM